MRRWCPVGGTRSADEFHGFLYSIAFLSERKESKIQALFCKFVFPISPLNKQINSITGLCSADIKDTHLWESFFPYSSSIMLEQKTANKIVRVLIYQNSLKDCGTQQFAFKGCNNLKRTSRIRLISNYFCFFKEGQFAIEFHQDDEGCIEFGILF